MMYLIDSPRYPVNVHIEAKAPGHLDSEKMRAAVCAALDKHPLARAKKIPPQPRDKQLFWEVSPALVADPFLVVEAGDAAALSRVPMPSAAA